VSGTYLFCCLKMAHCRKQCCNLASDMKTDTNRKYAFASSSRHVGPTNDWEASTVQQAARLSRRSPHETGTSRWAQLARREHVQDSPRFQSPINTRNCTLFQWSEHAGNTPYSSSVLRVRTAHYSCDDEKSGYHKTMIRTLNMHSIEIRIHATLCGIHVVVSWNCSPSIRADPTPTEIRVCVCFCLTALILIYWVYRYIHITGTTLPQYITRHAEHSKHYYPYRSNSIITAALTVQRNLRPILAMLGKDVIFYFFWTTHYFRLS
jgi:hypothetical protein